MAGSHLLRPDPGTGLAIVVMGVSGCGKSTVAAMLADALGCGFVEADDHHSQANKAKMSKGVPLTDEDRLPWLESLRDAIRERLGRSEDVAVSCSALRLKYREVLREGDSGYKAGSYAACRVKFVCLEASAEVIAGRVEWRAADGGHFMPASLVRSQLDLLEIDAAEGITVVDAHRPVQGGAGLDGVLTTESFCWFLFLNPATFDKCTGLDRQYSVHIQLVKRLADKQDTINLNITQFI